MRTAAMMDEVENKERPRPWIANRPERDVRGEAAEPETVCISITDPHRPASDRLPRLFGYEEVLRRQFCDLDPADAARQRLHRMRCRDCGEEMFMGDHVFNQRLAEEIAAFGRAHRGKSIMVHCAAGVSRSAAIAKVLLEAFPEYEDRTWPGHPNGHIVSLMRRAFGLPQLIETED